MQVLFLIGNLATGFSVWIPQNGEIFKQKEGEEIVKIDCFHYTYKGCGILKPNKTFTDDVTFFTGGVHGKTD